MNLFNCVIFVVALAALLSSVDCKSKTTKSYGLTSTQLPYFYDPSEWLNLLMNASVSPMQEFNGTFLDKFFNYTTSDYSLNASTSSPSDYYSASSPSYNQTDYSSYWSSFLKKQSRSSYFALIKLKLLIYLATLMNRLWTLFFSFFFFLVYINIF